MTPLFSKVTVRGRRKTSTQIFRRIVEKEEKYGQVTVKCLSDENIKSFISFKINLTSRIRRENILVLIFSKVREEKEKKYTPTHTHTHRGSNVGG